ncbi:MAG: hypothetical protein LQ346_005700 [Caloplaca aetnensis]|nr:MAG: hypothetical protein LQ346_005700 [Caloplaca aetnensis]
MRLRRTWFLSQCLANSETLEIASFDCYYDLYYTVLFHYLVQCVGICMRDASQTECSATCKTKDGSREQGMARSKQAFTCEADRCARKFDTGDKLKQHASNQHQASSPTTTTEPQSIDEAGFAIEEGAHAKLLGITVQASVEAKATASRLRISDQLRELMDEVPISRTGTWQQLQGPIRRAATRPYRAPPPFQGAKSRDTSNANKSAKPVEVLAGTTTSLARFGNVEGAHDTTKKPEAVNAQARPSDSGTSLVKPHIAHFKEIGSTSLVLSAQDVEVKPQYFTKPAENSTALQMVLAELSRGKRLLALARHENAVLIQERNDLRSKLFRVSEEQTALFQKAKADTAEELRREFNTVVDSLIRSA